MPLTLYPGLDSQALDRQYDVEVSTVQEAVLPQALIESELGRQVHAVLDARGLGQIGLRVVAQELAMSTRTLERKLAAQGQTFNGLVDAYRRDKALWLLRHTDYCMDQIATELGFCGSKNFSRTFRRWYGKTPSRMRKSEPAGAPLYQGALYQGTSCGT